MKTHVSLNKTVDWLCVSRHRTAYEPQPDETEKEGMDKRETEAMSTNKCMCAKINRHTGMRSVVTPLLPYTPLFQ